MGVDGPAVAVVVVNYRTPNLTLRCLQRLAAERTQIPRLQVIVVDGGSGDGSAVQLSRALNRPDFSSWVTFLPLSVNGGFGWANNQALRRLLKREHPPEYIHLLNPDTEIEAGAVGALADHLFRHLDAGAAGSQLLEQDGSPTGSAFNFPTLRGEFARGARTAVIERLIRAPPPSLPPFNESREVEWVTGASVMFRTEALRQAGLFDDGFFLYHEEIELMWRLRLGGWSVWHVPQSQVRHIGGAATGVHSRDVTDSISPRRPAYWYQSRRRFFYRTRGPTAALMAGILWMLGHAVWRCRYAVGMAGASKPTDRELADQFGHFFPRPSDLRAGDADCNSPMDHSPTWMGPT